MKNMPKLIKAERDLTGLLTVKFEDQDPGTREKEITRTFAEIRAGIAWPFRAVPGYTCILGHFAAVPWGAEKSTMLLYEAKYPDASQLMNDAYNKARDLRFQVFYTDCQKIEWRGFIYEFGKKIQQGLGGRDIRLKHSPFPNDFVLGKDRIKRLIEKKAVILPTAAILTEQLGNIRTTDLDTEHPEYNFPAVNAFRYLIVGWQTDLENQRTGGRADSRTDLSPLGWA